LPAIRMTASEIFEILGEDCGEAAVLIDSNKCDCPAKI